MADVRDAIYTATHGHPMSDGELADALLALIDECGTTRLQKVLDRLLLKGTRSWPNGTKGFELDYATRDWFIALDRL